MKNNNEYKSVSDEIKKGIRSQEIKAVTKCILRLILSWRRVLAKKLIALR
jgi:hypothetical protein